MSTPRLSRPSTPARAPDGRPSAEFLAEWAQRYVPSAEDMALGQRALLDTLAVTLAARDHPVRNGVAELPDAARWAAIGHVLDFDDLHVASTTHITSW